MKHFRVLRPAPNIIAYYDGRVEGYRFSDQENWVDRGALSLGTASYAIIDGDKALVYDTHVSLEHARFIRHDLEARGISGITVLLSHWHLDHVAGNAVFADCEIIATAKTLSHLAQHKIAIEDGSFHGPPRISPLVLPTFTFEGAVKFQLGETALDFIEANIHSDDAAVVWIEEKGILLAGDTMEDTVTYLGEPENIDVHLTELDRLWDLKPNHILPNHGHPDVIAAGGYGKSLIRATQQYLRLLRRMRDEPELRDLSLREIVSGPLEAGWIHYFAPYEAVHAQNLKQIVGTGKG